MKRAEYISKLVGGEGFEADGPHAYTIKAHKPGYYHSIKVGCLKSGDVKIRISCFLKSQADEIEERVRKNLAGQGQVWQEKGNPGGWIDAYVIVVCKKRW